MRYLRKKRIVPNTWKEFKIKDCFDTSSGATPLSTDKSYYEDGDIPWINSGELSLPYICETKNFISQKGFVNSSTQILPIDTVLVAMYGATAGKASLLKMKACTNQAICAILPNEEYDSTFIKYSIDTLYDYLVSLSTGSARDNLSQAIIRDLKIITPQSFAEQQKLSYVLSLIDKKILLNKTINHNLPTLDRSSRGVEVRHAA